MIDIDKDHLRSENAKLRKRVADYEDALNKLPEEHARTFKRLEIADRVCAAAASLVSEVESKPEVSDPLCYNVWFIMKDGIAEWIESF